MNRNEIYSSVTTFSKDTDDINYEALGGFSDATNRLHSVSIHDVQSVTRKTEQCNGTKCTTISIHTADGTINIHAFREHEA